MCSARPVMTTIVLAPTTGVRVRVMSAGPLAGVRALDVTSTFMGPYCTFLMARLGAQVIKIEPPGGALVRYIDDRRGTGMGPVFLNANRGKRSVVLDLAD